MNSKTIIIFNQFLGAIIALKYDNCCVKRDTCYVHVCYVHVHCMMYVNRTLVTWIP